MITRIDAVVTPRDFARFIDQDADALGIASLRVDAGTVRDAERPLGITQQGKIEIILSGESRVLLDATEAGAEDSNVLLVEVGLLIAEPATFHRSARSVCLGIEPKQNFLSLQIFQRKSLTLVRQKAEIWSDIAWFERHKAGFLSQPRSSLPFRSRNQCSRSSSNYGASGATAKRLRTHHQPKVRTA